MWTFRTGLVTAFFGLLSSPLLGCGSNGSSATPADPASMDSPATPPPDRATCSNAPYPVILAHGMAGFERIGPLNYFFNVAPDLAARGAAVAESQVSPYGSSMLRGTELARFVDATLAQTGSCKVNIIAHSQGGLDARYVISTLHYGDRIGGLITVGTPHAGTPVADAAQGLVPGFTADGINALLLAVQGLTSNQQGNPNIKASLAQLTTDTMKTWNASNPDDVRVRYYSVAGRSNLAAATQECSGSRWQNPSGLDILNPLLGVVAPVWTLTSPDPFKPTANDGLVPVSSARWGTFLGCMPADHFDEVGQIAELVPDPISGFFHIELYRTLLSQLRADGL